MHTIFTKWRHWALSSSSLCLCVIYLVRLYHLKSMGLSSSSSSSPFPSFHSVFFRCQNNFHRVDSVWFLLFSFITANQQHYYYCCACACACSFDLSSVHCAESGTIPKSCFAYLRWLLAKPYPARNTTFSTFSVAPLSPLSHSLPLA